MPIGGNKDTLTLEMLYDGDELNKGLKDSTDGFNKLNKTTLAIGATFVGLVGGAMAAKTALNALQGAVGALKDNYMGIIDSAAELEVTQKKLEIAVQNTGIGYEQYRGRIEAAKKASWDFAGASDKIVNETLTKLIAKTGDTSKALALLAPTLAAAGHNTTTYSGSMMKLSGAFDSLKASLGSGTMGVSGQISELADRIKKFSESKEVRLMSQTLGEIAENLFAAANSLLGGAGSTGVVDGIQKLLDKINNYTGSDKFIADLQAIAGALAAIARFGLKAAGYIAGIGGGSTASVGVGAPMAQGGFTGLTPGQPLPYDYFMVPMTGQEFVFSPQTTAAIGPERLDMINKFYTQQSGGFHAGLAGGGSAADFINRMKQSLGLTRFDFETSSGRIPPSWYWFEDFIKANDGDPRVVWLRMDQELNMYKAGQGGRAYMGSLADHRLYEAGKAWAQKQMTMDEMAAAREDWEWTAKTAIKGQYDTGQVVSPLLWAPGYQLRESVDTDSWWAKDQARKDFVGPMPEDALPPGFNPNYMKEWQEVQAQKRAAREKIKQLSGSSEPMAEPERSPLGGFVRPSLEEGFLESPFPGYGELADRMLDKYRDPFGGPTWGEAIGATGKGAWGATKWLGAGMLDVLSSLLPAYGTFPGDKSPGFDWKAIRHFIGSYGSFHAGGTVPGHPGENRYVLAQAGERFIPKNSGEDINYQMVQDGMRSYSGRTGGGGAIANMPTDYSNSAMTAGGGGRPMVDVQAVAIAIDTLLQHSGIHIQRTQDRVEEMRSYGARSTM